MTATLLLHRVIIAFMLVSRSSCSCQLGSLGGVDTRHALMCVGVCFVSACRYTAAGLAQPTLGQHMQCYVMSKVHSNQAAYGNAMSAILTGLEQHKYVQPEIAVFCRVSHSHVWQDYDLLMHFSEPRWFSSSADALLLNQSRLQIICQHLIICI